MFERARAPLTSLALGLVCAFGAEAQTWTVQGDYRSVTRHSDGRVGRDIRTEWTASLCPRGGGGSLSQELQAQLSFTGAGRWRPFSAIAGVSEDGSECRVSLSAGGILTATDYAQPDSYESGSGVDEISDRSQVTINLATGQASYRGSARYDGYIYRYTDDYVPYLVHDRSFTTRVFASGRFGGRNFCPALYGVSDPGGGDGGGEGNDQCPPDSGASAALDLYALVDPNNPLTQAASQVTADYIARHSSNTIAADGAAMLLLVARTDESGAVTFQLPPEAPGSLFHFAPGLNAAPVGAGARSLTITAGERVETGCGAGQGGLALAIYRAPEAGALFAESYANPSFNLSVSTANGASESLNIQLERPPLVFAHGLWGSPNSLAQFERIVRSDYPAYPTHLLSYDGAAAYDAPETLARVQRQFDALIETSRRAGLAAAEIDVVAHSMGGLTARRLRLDHENAEPGDPVARINRIVTLNSPTLGSPLADLLVDQRETRMEAIGLAQCLANFVPGLQNLATTNPKTLAYTLAVIALAEAVAAGVDVSIGEFLEGRGMEIGGGVLSLRENDQAQIDLVLGLESNHIGMTGAAPGLTALEIQMQALICLGGVENESGAPLALTELLGTGHDGIVPLVSQSANTGRLHHFSNTHNLSVLADAGFNDSLSGNRAVYVSREVATCVARVLGGAEGPCDGEVSRPSSASGPRMSRAAQGDGSVDPKIVMNSDILTLSSPETWRLGESAELEVSIDAGRIVSAEFVFVPAGIDGAGASIVDGERLTDTQFTASAFIGASGEWLGAALVELADGSRVFESRFFSVQGVGEAIDLIVDQPAIPGPGDPVSPSVRAQFLDLNAPVDVSEEVELVLAPSVEPLLAETEDGLIALREGRASGVVRFGELEEPIEFRVGQAQFEAPRLRASILPSSRTARIDEGGAVSAFATLVNRSRSDAIGCQLAWPAPGWESFSYRRTEPATNRPIGAENPVFDIPARSFQTLVFSVSLPEAPPSEYVFVNFACEDGAANVSPGVNTLAVNAVSGPAADVISIAQTPTSDGIARFAQGGRGAAFAVAMVNIADGEEVRLRVRLTGDAADLTATACETDASTGACSTARLENLTFQAAQNGVRTFSVFLRRDGQTVPLAPATTRAFIEFVGPDGETRGATSVAVTAP